MAIRVVERRTQQNRREQNTQNKHAPRYRPTTTCWHREKLIVIVEPQLILRLRRENARAQVIEDIEKAWKL